MTTPISYHETGQRVEQLPLFIWNEGTNQWDSWMTVNYLAEVADAIKNLAELVTPLIGASWIKPLLGNLSKVLLGQEARFDLGELEITAHLHWECTETESTTANTSEMQVIFKISPKN